MVVPIAGDHSKRHFLKVGPPYTRAGDLLFGESPPHFDHQIAVRRSPDLNDIEADLDIECERRTEAVSGIDLKPLVSSATRQSLEGRHQRPRDASPRMSLCDRDPVAVKGSVFALRPDDIPEDFLRRRNGDETFPRQILGRGGAKLASFDSNRRKTG